MKKKVFGRHFSRSRRAREALFKSLIKAFILHGKIETTYAKAKAVVADIDKVVIVARQGGVAKERQISASLSADREIVSKLVKDVSSFKERKSGFTRIIRLPNRKGDAAEIARLEWVDQIEVPKIEKAKKKTEKKKIKKKKGGKAKDKNLS